MPSIPLLHPEFQNPLFLLLFCQGLYKSGHTKIPDGLQGITAIIDFFINSINTVLSAPTRLNYSRSINVVKKSIQSLIEYKIAKELHYIPYEEAFLLVDKISNEFSAGEGLLDELISEGILSKNLFWHPKKNDEEGVYIAYERFEDHLIATYILNTNIELDKAFKKNGQLFHLVKNENTCYINKGLIEALAIQLPETINKEFYEFVPHFKNSRAVIECFLQSLLWRKTETITEKLLPYINTAVFTKKYTYDLFWDTVISVSTIPDHYFNAYFLHKQLMRFSMANRDAWWTIYLKQQLYDESAVKRLIDWAWNNHDNSHISDDSIKLATITLSWFHTSTNRKLRDSATKAMICLLKNRITVLIEVLKEFENVNDPYIYERLFAVAYGCALRTEEQDKLKKLSEYIFETIFENKERVYPHILLRDYARGVIEYTKYSGIELSFDTLKARPPYKSSFDKKFPTDKEIEQLYKPKNKEGHYGEDKWGDTAILSSMATENKKGMYGDFGRYVFQSAFSSWNIDTNGLSNLAIKWIFEKYGYDSKLFNSFDLEIGSGRARDTLPHERIGKKYQWIAFYEMLARVSDNFTKYVEWSSRHEEEEDYQGPWNPYVRDIDPTIIIKKTGVYKEKNNTEFWWSKEKYKNWELQNDEWIRNNKDLPEPKTIINIMDSSGMEWLLLEGSPEWLEPKKIGDEKWENPQKMIWYQIRSYLIQESDYKKFKEWAPKQNFMGRWMPESPRRYKIFSREYYWSPAYSFFNNNDYYGEPEVQTVNDDITGECIGKVILTANDFLWEEEFDMSKEDVINFLKPSKYIYDKMKLKFSKKEGEFLGEKGELICFDPSVYFDSNSCLLIKKAPFLRCLQENNLRIIWTLLGEKNIIGNSFNRKAFHGRLEMNGTYYLNENNEIDGTMKFLQTGNL